MITTWFFEALSRNWAMVAMISTIVILVLVPWLVLMKYVRISLNIMRATKPPLARSPLDFEPLSGEVMHFTAYDGVRLVGMLVRARGAAAARGVIVFAHEFCSDMHSCARYVAPLIDAGYDIFTFDFRGHGQSENEPDYTPRQWITEREIYDIRGAIAAARDWAEQRGLSREIGIVGVSRGASAAIAAAAEDPQIRALVADGAFSTDTTIEFLMKRWAYIFARVKIVYENHPPAFWRFLRWCMIFFARREFKCRFPSVRKAVQRMEPRPLLFIHGEKDSYLPVEQTRKLYALAPQPKYLWLAPGARHNQAAVLHADFYARLLINFFDCYLAQVRVLPTADPIAAVLESGRLGAAQAEIPALRAAG